jgi:hypothetical protein
MQSTEGAYYWQMIALRVSVVGEAIALNYHCYVAKVYWEVLTLRSMKQMIQFDASCVFLFRIVKWRESTKARTRLARAIIDLLIGFAEAVDTRVPIQW